MSSLLVQAGCQTSCRLVRGAPSETGQCRRRAFCGAYVALLYCPFIGDDDGNDGGGASKQSNNSIHDA